MDWSFYWWFDTRLYICFVMLCCLYFVILISIMSYASWDCIFLMPYPYHVGSVYANYLMDGILTWCADICFIPFIRITISKTKKREKILVYLWFIHSVDNIGLQGGNLYYKSMTYSNWINASCSLTGWLYSALVFLWKLLVILLETTRKEKWNWECE